MAVGGGSASGTTTSNNVTSGFRTISATTANVKGSWTELIASTAEDYDALLVAFAISASNTSHLIDIGIGASAAEVVVMADIHTSIANNITEWVVIPKALPAGTRIATRSQCSTASGQYRVGVVGVKGGWYYPQGGGDIATLGANAADSGGTQLDSGATANTFGAWVQLTASTANPIKAICLRTGAINNAAATTGQALLQVGVGAAAAEQGLFEVPFAVGAVGSSFGPMPEFWFPVSIPAGTRVAARWMSTIIDATDRLIDVVAYGLEA
jgi:hypothetical protein